jgi:hypothetical protein
MYVSILSHDFISRRFRRLRGKWAEAPGVAIEKSVSPDDESALELRERYEPRQWPEFFDSRSSSVTA